MNKLRSFYRGKVVLVPGGAGFIGSNLAKRLVSLGANVTIVDSFDPSCGANKFNIKEIMSSIVFAKKSIEKFLVSRDINKYDVVFNCVGLSNHHIGPADIRKDYDINCASALAILRDMARKRSGARLISIGSRSQYGKAGSRHVNESCPMDPIDIQAVHKTTLEGYHRIFADNYGLDLIFARLTNVYGPCQRIRGYGMGLAGEMLRDCITGRNITVFGSLKRVKDMVYVDDAVLALLLLGAAKKRAHLTYNIGGAKCTLADLTGAIAAASSARIRIKPFSGKIKKMDTGDVVLDAGRIKRLTGWKARTGIREGIDMTIGYFKENRKYYL